jgi:hypothetical protein
MFSDRLLAGVAAAKLDHELASGVREDANPALAWRARKLVAPRAREQLGQALRRIVRDANRPPVLSPRVSLVRDRVVAAEFDLRLLASRLQSPAAVSPRGVAKTRLLLTDGTGPLFYARSDKDLGTLVRDATAALG